MEKPKLTNTPSKDTFFSVMIPVYYGPRDPNPRFKSLHKAINSVLNQTYQAFELIVIDDGCEPAYAKSFPKHSKIRSIRIKQNSGRLVARNKGLEDAKGKWFCMLDSDDEYASVYLECLNEAIKLYPKAKVFNFGSILYHKDYGTTLRPTFRPKKLDVGHEPFGSGKIGLGSFAFHREVYEDVGGFPEKGIWDFAEHAKKQFPELRAFFPGTKELGNPYGDDFYLYYKMTRKYHSQPLDTCLYIQHGKEAHKLKKETK